MEAKNYKYKIIFLGASGAGAKTSLINRFIGYEFNYNIPSTITPNIHSIFIQADSGVIYLELWDTPGQVLYRNMNKLFIRDSNCVILGYAIDCRSSFDEIKEYHYNTVKNILVNEPLIYLVANKIDLFENEEEVSVEEAKNIQKKKI